MACSCGSKKSRTVAKFSNVSYVLQDPAGRLVREFDSKSVAAKEAARHPGYSLHPVENP